ncbi:hypothetical protein [Calidifontibacillus erzurumensis]|uniref:Uncharacterized protein n=1 Tax=Calidifontibacillus erzurumensis TaxID=2741433 RepID=A0A8J8GEI7_9BACI|nr:hypothetical protein [Calidifontibacillus erzurumensis]NSL51701.1 hypothetical protein [Calidifontibacillus erzurumensis]
MAYNLTAVLQLKDKYSKPMRQAIKVTEQLNKATKIAQKSTDTWRNANGRLRDSMGRFIKDGNLATKVFSGITKGAGGALSSVTKLTGAFVALSAAIGGYKLSKGIFDKTIGEAAKYEQSSVTVKTMFQDDAKYREFVKMAERVAIESPLLNSQDLFANAKSFVTKTSDIKQLERIFKIIEKLNVIDPVQGVQGAALSLKELLSGDIVSMYERFEIFTRDELNAIKDLPLGKQLDAFEKLLKKKRITDEVVTELGNTTLGIWNQIKEQTDVVLRTMGQPALMRIRDFLARVNNEMQKGDKRGIESWGAKVLDGIAKTFVTAADNAGKWIKGIMDNPEFNKQKTLTAKIEFIFDDLYAKFKNWYDSGGRDQFVKTTTKITEVLAEGIHGASTTLTPIAAQLGASIGKGIADGLKSYMENHPITKVVSPYASDRVDMLKGKVLNWGISKTFEILGAEKVPKGRSHASGLSYVPYNGYTAILHKGERVLTPEENREYSKGGGGIHIAKLAEHIVVREEADIDKIAWKITKNLQRAVEAGA